MAESWAITEELLLETRALAAAHGSAFGVVLVPAPWEVYPELWQEVLARNPGMREASYDLARPSSQLGAFLRRHGISSLDLLPRFRERAASMPRLYFVSDHHWTAEGHGLAAELLAGTVADMLRFR